MISKKKTLRIRKTKNKQRTLKKKGERMKQISKKNKLRIDRKNGGGEIFNTKKLPIDVNNMINSYLDPVYALHSKNPLWKVEMTHGNEVVLLSKDEKCQKYLEDDTFLLSFRSFIDYDIKSYVFEKKLHSTDPKNVHAKPCYIITRYNEILITIIWHIDDNLVERVYHYNPITKTFSLYLGAEYFITPIKYPTKELLDEINFLEVLKFTNPINASNEVCEKNDNQNSELFEEAKTLRKDIELGYYPTDEENIFLRDINSKDKYTCEKHLKRYHDEFLTLPLNRRTLHELVNSSTFNFKVYKEEEDREYFIEINGDEDENSSNYESEVDHGNEDEDEDEVVMSKDDLFMFQKYMRQSNRRVMRILNELLHVHKGNMDNVFRALLIGICKVYAFKKKGLKGNNIFLSNFGPYDKIFEHDRVI